MPKKSRAERRKEIHEALREANVGCLLMFVLGFGLPLVAAGAFFVWMGVAGVLDQARLNTSAVPIPATIVESGTTSSTSRTGSGAGMRTQSHFASITFEYEHAGATHTSDRIWPFSQGGSAAEMRALAQRYPVGADVTAYVNPNVPSEAFLERRWSSVPYAVVFMGLLPLSFVAFLGVLLAGWKRPPLAMSVSVGVMLVIGGLGGWLVAHHAQNMPPTARAWWMWPVFAGGAVMAVAPLLAMVKARRLRQILDEG